MGRWGNYPTCNGMLQIILKIRGACLLRLGDVGVISSDTSTKRSREDGIR